MIASTLSFLQSELNNYIGLKTSDFDKLEVNHLVGETGNYLTPNMGMHLVNLEEDRTSQPLPRFQENSEGRIQKLDPEVKLNVYILFTANFTDNNNYSEALKHIGYVATYFQSRNVFTPQNFPSLPSGIEKLTAELISLSFEQQNHLWGTLGAKYLPSVLYRLRVIYLEDLTAPVSGEKVRIIKRDYSNINE